MSRPNLAITILAVLVACDDPPPDNPDAPAGAPDAPATAPPDASPPDAGPASPLLPGTWREIPSSFEDDAPVEERTLATLEADGTYAILENDMTETGTWTATDRTITFAASDAPGPGPVTVGYVATADQLVLSALFPDGPVNGTVGTWRGDARVGTNDITLSLQLRADNTARWERHSSNGDELYDGTWSYDAADVVFTTMVGMTTVNIHFQEIRGVALGSLYERLPATARAHAVTRRGPVVVDAIVRLPRVRGD